MTSSEFNKKLSKESGLSLKDIKSLSKTISKLILEETKKEGSVLSVFNFFKIERKISNRKGTIKLLDKEFQAKNKPYLFSSVYKSKKY